MYILLHDNKEYQVNVISNPIDVNIISIYLDDVPVIPGTSEHTEVLTKFNELKSTL